MFREILRLHPWSRDMDIVDAVMFGNSSVKIANHASQSIKRRGMLAGPSFAARIFLAAPTVSSEIHQGIGLELAEAWEAVVDDCAKRVVVCRLLLSVFCQRREADLPD